MLVRWRLYEVEMRQSEQSLECIAKPLAQHHGPPSQPGGMLPCQGSSPSAHKRRMIIPKFVVIFFMHYINKQIST